MKEGRDEGRQGGRERREVGGRQAGVLIQVQGWHHVKDIYPQYWDSGHQQVPPLAGATARVVMGM